MVNAIKREKMMENSRNTLYYYCDQTNLLRMLESKKLRFCDLIKSTGYYDITQLIAKQYLQRKSYIPYNDFENHITNVYSKKSFFGITLFEDENKTSQWNRYIDGLAIIVFNKEKLKNWCKNAFLFENNDIMTQKMRFSRDDIYLEEVIKNLSDKYALLLENMLNEIIKDHSLLRPQWRIYFPSYYKFVNNNPVISINNEKCKEKYSKNESTYYFDLPLPFDAIEKIIIKSKIDETIKATQNAGTALKEQLFKCKELDNKKFSFIE